MKPISGPKPEGRKPRVEGNKQNTVGRKPGIASRVPRTSSGKPGASDSGKPATGYRGQKPEGRGPRVESRKPGVLGRGTRPAAAGPKPMARGPRPGTGQGPTSGPRPVSRPVSRPSSTPRPSEGPRPGPARSRPATGPRPPATLGPRPGPTRTGPVTRARRPSRAIQNPPIPQSDKDEGRASNPQSGERLQKVLAHAGVASRRAAEEMIAAGRVMVNGEIVKEMGLRVQATDVIQVDSKRLTIAAPAQAAQELVYIAINKPLGVVSTSKDPQGRTTVIDLLRGRQATDEKRQSGGQNAIQNQRVYPIGRLDVDSTGLLLLTNDGDLTFRITHPRYGLEKEYRVLVRGRPGAEVIQKLRDGVDIEGGLTAPAKVEHLTSVSGNTWLRVTIHEGRKRQVRLMAAAVGHPVIELSRTRVGPIVLGDLEPGRWRYLALHEVHALRKAVGLHATNHPRQRNSTGG